MDLVSKGNELYLLGKNLEAIDSYHEAIKFNPNIAEAYINKGIALSDLGKLEEAIQCYNHAIRIDPNDTTTFLSKGIALKELGRIEEAIISYDEALKIDPNNSSAQNNKGLALRDMEKLEEALKCYEEAIKIDPNNSNAYYNKGNVLKLLDRKEEAIISYDEAIKIDPSDSHAYNNKGNALSDLGKKDEALKCYEEAIKINPFNSSAYYNKGNFYYENGNKEEALKCFDEAIKMNGSNPIYQLKKAIILKQIEKEAEAIRCIENLEKLIYDEKNLQGTIKLDLNYFKEQIKLLNENSKLNLEYTQSYELVKQKTKNYSFLDKSETGKKKLNQKKFNLLSGIFNNINKSPQFDSTHYEELRRENEEVRKLILENKRELEEYRKKNEENEKKREEEMNDINILKHRVSVSRIDYFKELQEYLKAQSDINDKKLIADYYTGFITTMNAAYSNATVISSGDLVIDNDSKFISGLSMFVSFIPLVGDIMEKLVESVGKDYKEKVILDRAKRFTYFFSSNGQIDDVVGRVLKEFICQKDSINKIYYLNENKVVSTFFQKIKQKYNDAKDKIEEKIYGKQIINSHYKLGCDDCNHIISICLSDNYNQIDYFNIEDRLYEEIRLLFAQRKVKELPIESNDKYNNKSNNIQNSNTNPNNNESNDKKQTPCGCYFSCLLV